ncbi:Duffy receptor alpha form [Frankliniella fusca]|uniref:Duffy receptor alpha form n=1 Tax=Frankliniella fusca TaxID=407009 RepID=A0AAE1L701_9NEOP|nr:Duffy receptor alpha form [Frankliniella fusca]
MLSETAWVLDRDHAGKHIGPTFDDSNEEWNEEPSEDSLFLVQPGRVGGGWRGSHASAELSLPRARRVQSPAASPSPTSPAAPGSLTRDRERDHHPLAGAAPAAAGPRRRHASPTPPLDRNNLENSRKIGQIQKSSRHDAKEKFLSLERERLEEQERVMQLNLERRRSGPQQQPLPSSPAQWYEAVQGRYTGRSVPFQIVEPPISPAMGPCPRPRPRPRRPSWSRSRGDSEDEVPEVPEQGGKHHAARYYPDDDEDDDVDFSGNAPPTGGRQRIIAAVNRRMSRESLEDDVEEFVSSPTRPGPTSRPGPPRHEHPAGYRGGDSPARADHVGRDYPVRDHLGRDYPIRDHPVRDHPVRDHPVRDHPGRDHIGRDHLGRDHPVRELSSRDQHPSRDHPSRGDHSARNENPGRAEHPIRDIPGRDYPGREHPVREHPGRGGDQPRPGGDHHAAVFRSRSVHRDRRDREALEDRYRSPARAHPVDEAQRYRIPYNEDMDIPLERYRSGNPQGPGRAPAPTPRLPLPVPMPYPHHEADDDPPLPRAADPRAYLADKKRRSVFEALEEERRRHSNELAQEFKRRSYQELDERERYPGLDRETARDPVPSGPPPGHPGQRTQVSPRYRHSYAEPPPRHHDLLHRANSAASPRVGIAAVHPY